jgi:UDP-N-acetyl-D-galactosamine dehydrogenase
LQVLSPERTRLAVVGLGYVGLPLAVEFGKVMPTLGYDIDPERIAELQAGRDSTREVDAAAFGAATGLSFSCDPRSIAECNVFVIAVPTPIDRFRQPDLEPLKAATALVGGMLKGGDLVVFESTVYPGATEEVCVPLLEAASGLAFNSDFVVGYSPERMNPGDRQHRVTDILKVTSGSTPEAADAVDALYRKIVRVGTHKVSSIRVAEAAKVIENTQRDVNIALVNELALIFNRLGIDTREVLEAAGTKWNFIPFRPGLVGGHCIGVDPYYLTHKAQEIGYHPEVILAGRRINDSMGGYVAAQVFGLMSRSHLPVCDARVLVMGLAFKENCPDLRNTRVIDLIRQLQAWRARVDVYDPCIDPADAQREYGIEPVAQPQPGNYDAIVLAVAHRQFGELGAERIRAFGKADCVVYDVKGVLPRDAVDGRL